MNPTRCLPLALLALSFAASAQAQTVTQPTAVEATKAKLVGRIHQLTLGSEPRCAHPGVASDFHKELGRFRRTYDTLMRSVVESSHYEPARQRFARQARFDPVSDTIDRVSGECEYLASLMRSMIDTPQGQQSVREIEATLAR